MAQCLKQKEWGRDCLEECHGTSTFKFKGLQPFEEKNPLDYDITHRKEGRGMVQHKKIVGPGDREREERGSWVCVE